MTPDIADDITTLRAAVAQADTDSSQAAAVRSAVEAVHDRLARGTVPDARREAAVETFARYVSGEQRREELSYLTEALVPQEDGDGASVFDATLDPVESSVESLVADFQAYVTGESVSEADLTEQAEAILTEGTPSEVASLASFADRLLRAARAMREDRTAKLNETGWTSDDGDDVGAVTAFLEKVDDEVAEVPDQPIALFPVRLETRFVTPNDDRPERLADTVANAGRAVVNRTDPGQAELRVRIYPDQIHADSHEPELTDDEEAWGKNFWAQLWFACHETRVIDPSDRPEADPIPVIRYDRPKRDMVPDDDAIHRNLSDLADRRRKFSADGADFHHEVKERAWRQIVDRFGRERGAYVVHELAPTERANDILVGWTGNDVPPWPRGGPAGEPSPAAPELRFPAVDRRPDSWNQPPRARLLPDRWLVVGHWRPSGEPEASPTTLRTETGAVRDPLSVGPNPEAVAEDELETAEGDAPEGMEWMTDYDSAVDAGMAVTITADDLDGTDPRDVVFETLLVLGVSASRDGETSAQAIRSTLESHHYTDGLEFLERGTPTNNHDLDSGYTRKDEPVESLRHECDAPLVTFGDFSDGDLVARALGIADPTGDHVFAHVEGADGTTQANARHMNSLLWPGTIGYYLRNVVVSNRWTRHDSIWDGVEDFTGESFPNDPMNALGEGLKWTDAMRRHFVKYVRAGGPFPPLRCGRQPYGLLPVSAFPDEDDEGGIGFGGLLGDERLDLGDSVFSPDGPVAGGPIVDGSIPIEDRRDDDAIDTGEERGGDDDATTQPGLDEVIGSVARSGYGVYTDVTSAGVRDSLYGSSFDPAVPASSGATSLRTAARPNDATLTDGGVLDGRSYIRPRYFQRDQEISEEITTLLGKVTPAWRDSVDAVDCTSRDDPTRVIEDILGREATADEYVDEAVYGLDPWAEPVWVQQERQLEEVRRTLRDHDLTDLDPRIGWLFPPPAHDWEIGYGEERARERDRDAGDVPWLIDGRAPEYLNDLVTPRHRGGRDHLDALQTMGYRFNFEWVDVDREDLRDIDGVKLPTNIDEVDDDTLALYLVLTAPDHGKLGEMFSSGVFSPDLGMTSVDVGSHVRKGIQLIRTEGLALQNTLFKQLTRFSLLQSYVGARIRLGTMFDEDLFPHDGGGLLATGIGLNGRDPLQQPVPEPTTHTDDTRTVWEALEDEPPASAPIERDQYIDLFWDTCRPGTDPPPIDPRLSEVYDSLAHLQTLEPETLGRLMGETLDLASYRLDAWWTSLATRQLYEQRERQEAAMFAGDEYAFVGRHFRGAPGVAGQTPGERALDSSPTIGGTALRRNDEGRVVVSDAAGAGEQPVDLGSIASRVELFAGADTTGEDTDDEDLPEPATFIGAYGFVEDLRADADERITGSEAEYIHAPSPQQATTAAILRSGRKNHADDEAFRDVLDIDLSPGRVRAARQVLDAVRQGQQMADVLGYRFERRLLERTKSFNESVEAAGGGASDTINLVRYKWDFRRAYPGTEGKLDHGDVDPSLEDEAAKSDVVDGYSLYKAWDERDDEAGFLSNIDREDGDTLDADLGSDEREQLVAILEELDAIVDAVADLLIAENVHQLGRGNFDRAGGTLDDLAKGNAVADPEVTDTPMADVGISHRQFVAFGPPSSERSPDHWTYDTPTVSPDTLPNVGLGSTGLNTDAADSSTLQHRPTGEPNLNGWVGTLLPDPGRVSCEATFGWEEDRAVGVGTIAAPGAPGTVQITDLGFDPDLVELTVAHGVGKSNLADPAGTMGWTHGVAARTEDGIEQHTVSVDLDPESDEGGGIVETDAALRVVLHEAEGRPGGLTAKATFLDNGFELEFTDVAPSRLPEGVQVQYRAYDLGNPVGIDVGHEVTPTSTGDQSIEVEVDADAVTFVGTTVSTGSDTLESTAGTVGFANGMASQDSTGAISQHVVATGVDASTGDVVTGAWDDRALVLPIVSGASLDGKTSAAVQSLGSTLELSYSEIHAGSRSDAARVLSYIAVQTPDEVSAPSVATVTPGSLTEGDSVTVPTGNHAGAIEVLSVGGLDGTGDATELSSAGWSVGVATGVGAQQVLSHVYREDVTAQAGGVAKGDLVSLPAIAEDGSVSGETILRVTSVGDTELDLEAVSAGGETPILLVRTWPSAPQTVTHTATTGATLDDLAVSPLDAIQLAQPRDDAGASELEKRFNYHLSRNRPPSDPPVPDRATLELAFQTPAPDANGDDPLTVAEFLELARTIGQVIGDGRALDAEDLGHPGEIGDQGYTDTTAIELADRALEGQRALAAAGTTLENRVARFDVDEDEKTVTEQVASLREAVARFRESVPVDGAQHVGVTTDAELGVDRDALHADLVRVAAHFPAGETDPDVADTGVMVYPLTGQPLEGPADPDNETTLHVWSTSGVDRFDRQVTIPADGEAEFEVELDFAGVRPGTTFGYAVKASGTVLEADSGQVVLPPDDLVASPASGQRLRVMTDLDEGTSVTATVASMDGGTEYASQSREVDDFGAVSVDVDFSGVQPWTFFEAAIDEGGTTVTNERGYVAGDAGRAAAEGDVLPELLWLELHQETFDPYDEDSPAHALYQQLEAGAVDWDVLNQELSLMRDLEGLTPGEPPTSDDTETVAALVDEGDGGPALESLDLGALDAAVLAVGRELRELDLPDLFGVSGRPDRAGGVRFYPNRDRLADERSQDRLAAGISRPGLLTDQVLSIHGFSPSLSRFMADEAEAVSIRESDAERLRAYLAAFAEFLPLMVDDLANVLEDPVDFAQQFEQLVHDPTSFPSGSARSRFRGDLRRLTRTSVLDGVTVIDDLLSLADISGSNYNIDSLLLDTETDDELSADARDLLEDYFGGDTAARRALRDRGFAPRSTPEGTGITDLRFHLEVFRRLMLEPYLDRLDAGTLPPDEAASKATFGSAVRSNASSLETTASAAATDLAAARGSPRFDRAFRRGILETIRRALHRVSYFGVYASTPNSAIGGTAADESVLLSQARTILEAVKDTHSTVDDLSADRDGSGDVTDPPSIDSQIERLETLYGEEFTVLPGFEPTNSAELTATFGRSDELLGGDPLAAETWFQRVSRVRDRSATYRRALSYAEAVTGERHRDLSVGQLPHRPTDEWVGLEANDPDPGRLSLVAQFGDAFSGDFSGQVTGLFVDEHVENIPSPTTTSGVALNYDDPDTTAPHAVLLAVPPADENGWSRSAMESVVTDTIELLKLRLVDLQDLGDFYQLLPMLYLPDNNAIQPDAPSVDLERIQDYHASAQAEWAEYHYRVAMPAIGMVQHMGIDGDGGGG